MATIERARGRAQQLRTVTDLGALVRDVRTQRGWTQAVLAKKAAVGRQWLVAVESGRHDRAEWGKVMQVLRALSIELLVTTPTDDTDAGQAPADSRGERGEARRAVDLSAIIDGLANNAS